MRLPVHALLVVALAVTEAPARRLKRPRSTAAPADDSNAAAASDAQPLSYSAFNGAESYSGPDSYSAADSTAALGGSGSTGSGLGHVPAGVASALRPAADVLLRPGAGASAHAGMTAVAFNRYVPPPASAYGAPSGDSPSSGSLNGHSRPYSNSEGTGSHSGNYVGNSGTSGASSSHGYQSSGASGNQALTQPSYASHAVSSSNENSIGDGEYRAILASLKAVEAYAGSRRPNSYSTHLASGSGAPNSQTYHAPGGEHGTSSISLTAGYQVGGHGSSPGGGSSSSSYSSTFENAIYGTPISYAQGAPGGDGHAQYAPSDSSGHSGGQAAAGHGGSGFVALLKPSQVDPTGPDFGHGLGHAFGGGAGSSGSHAAADAGAGYAAGAHAAHGLPATAPHGSPAAGHHAISLAPLTLTPPRRRRRKRYLI